MMTEFNIVNIVGVVVYQQKLDLSELNKTFENREEVSSITYNPIENHWLQTRFAPDETYVSFYRTGKCSIVGAISTDHFNDIVTRVNKIMRDLLDFNYEPTAEIKNIVATSELNSLPSLNALAVSLGLDRTEYEPEQFSGLIYRGDRFVALIFSSGKMVCTGLRDVKSISSAINDLTKKIKRINID